MKLAIYQPYFFPYLGYFQLISVVDKFILYDRLNYIRHGWVNRNRLLAVNHGPAYFVIPLRAHGIDTKIHDIYIDNRIPWQRRMHKQIEMNYRRSPFFDKVFPVIEMVLAGKEEYLSDLNRSSISAVCSFLEISTPVISDGQDHELLEGELGRDGSSIKAFYLEQQQVDDVKIIRILELCKKERASIYINAIGGRYLYDKQTFARGGVNLFFLQTLPHSYPQRSSTFIPGLSIIDVLMNCGKEGTQKLLDRYELIQ